MVTAPHMRQHTSPLHFKPLTLADIPVIDEFLHRDPSRTCDYTIGGIYMWIDYFSYRYCIVEDTLFIEGTAEDDPGQVAYSLPIGTLSLPEAIGLLRIHCETEGHSLRFSAIPEDKLHLFSEAGSCVISPLTDWSDYLYDAQALATLSGNALKKKRNHVNRFLADNPGTTLLPLTSADIPEVKQFLTAIAPEQHQSLLAQVERTQTYHVLDNWDAYSAVFSGALLRDKTGRLVAFAIGETVGDTLFVHIEKMDHEVPGAGESINKLFAGHMLAEYPGIRYINREEDVGDPGLRAAKQSYHPAMLLPKYNVLIDG